MGDVAKLDPVDQEVRDLATREVGRSIALSAGAGSGKTTVLTSRLVNVLASGVEPSRVAAITFTEKAAGELQRRVRDALEARLRASPDDDVLRGQLERFHELRLSTIHSFCRELLTTEPLASQWAPGTDVAGRDSRGLAKGLTAWRRTVAAEDPLLLGLFDLKLARRPLRESALALVANRDLEPAVADAGIDWEAAHDELSGVREAIEDAASGCTAPNTDKLLANNAALREAPYYENLTTGEKKDRHSITSFLTTRVARRIYGKAAHHFDSMAVGDLHHPDHRPTNRKGQLITDALTNAEALTEAKHFLEYATVAGHRATPHR